MNLMGMPLIKLPVEIYILLHSTASRMQSLNLLSIIHYSPKLLLKHLEVSGEKNDSVFNVKSKSAVTVPAGFNSLYIEFASLSFAATEKNTFKIMLENYDRD